VEELDNILLPEVFRKLCVVFPLYKARLAINVLFQLLEKRLATLGTLHGREVALHALEELLLVNVAIQVPEGFVASIIPNSTCTSAYGRQGSTEY
jgi:hypothetical protein